MPLPHFGGNYRIYRYCSNCYRELEMNYSNSGVEPCCGVQELTTFGDKIEEMLQKRKEYLRTKKLERIINI